MKQLLFALTTLAAAALILPGRAQAQVSNWELNLHGGAYRYDLGFDDDNDEENTDTDVLLGARLVAQRLEWNGRLHHPAAGSTTSRTGLESEGISTGSRWATSRIRPDPRTKTWT